MNGAAESLRSRGLPVLPGEPTDLRDGDDVPRDFGCRAGARDLGNLDPKAFHASRVQRDDLAGRGGRLPFFARIQQAFGRHDVSGIEAHVAVREWIAREPVDKPHKQPQRSRR